MPDFSYESKYDVARICGVDEAGRGPLAGPVVAAAVIFPRPYIIHDAIADSKTLSAKKREKLYSYITEHAAYGVGICSAQEIDSINILQASLLAMRRAVESLTAQPDIALIDGNKAPALNCPAQCIVKGDSLSMSIAAASIIAKVTRDRIMAELANTYPEYGFEAHAGYGTRQHLDAIKNHGITPAHRRSFAPIKSMLSQSA